MALVHTDDFLALYKFDGLGLLFRNSDGAETLLEGFHALPPAARLEAARMILDGWREGRIDESSAVVVGTVDSFPPALPNESVIALSGYERRFGIPGDVPTLDSDGYPNNPAAAMEVYERLANA